MPILQPSADAIAEAARRLRAGGVVAFPTETVYGLGADTFNEDAIAEVYRLKDRPFDNPLIAHVEGVAAARELAAAGAWDSRCDTLAERFWPGPLTIVVAKSSAVPALTTAGYSTIALRCPAHPVARALLAAYGGAISAPSANRSGHVSPTAAEHVAHDFAQAGTDAGMLILDGGPCAVGIESTVLDLSGTSPRILRPGAVTSEALGEALGVKVVAASAREQLASPGTSPAHYAPRTPAELVESERLESRLAALDEPAAVLVHHHRAIAPPHHAIELPDDDVRYAAQLYAALRQADTFGAARLLIEKPRGEGELWDAIRDRLCRAAAR
jgi:L-threonylcarbamoyladenylate synthase